MELNNTEISSSTNYKKNSQLNVMIWKILNDALSKILNIISISSVDIKWIENIEKDKVYFFLANHPSYIDWILLKNIFLNLWIKSTWIIHNSILESKYIWDFLNDNWYIWVLNKRDYNYYINKWYSHKDAKKNEEERLIKAKQINKTAYKKSIDSLEWWKSLFMFICWWWYENLWNTTTFYNWYKKIISMFLENNKNLNICPISFDFEDWFKKWCFPFRNKLTITFNKTSLVHNENKDSIYEEINLLLK